jgi:hypothetical protein
MCHTWCRCEPCSYSLLELPTRFSVADAAPNGANQRRTRNHSTNVTAACTTDKGVPAWMPDSTGTLR